MRRSIQILPPAILLVFSAFLVRAQTGEPPGQEPGFPFPRAVTTTDFSDVVAAPGVTRFEVTLRESPTFQGRSFGTVGQYEKIYGIAYMEVDPKDPRNQRITDIDLAPVNERGMVEISADVHMVKPIDLSRGNRTIFYGLNNRGNKSGLGVQGNNPTLASDADPRLMERGYTLVWSGWEDESFRPPGNYRVNARLPVARNPDGSSITGEHLYEFSFDIEPGDQFGLIASGGGAGRDFKYRPANTDPGSARMLVRNNSRFVGGPLVERREVPHGVWQWVDEGTVRVDRSHEFLAPYDAGAAFEFIYLARDPVILGLGFAAVRDVVSFLRHDDSDANPLRGGIDHAIAKGRSQSGRWLRTFIYYGFNEDLEVRKVFEGIMPVVAGAHRIAMDERWGDTDATGRSYMRDTGGRMDFPFTYEVRTDPVSGANDGLFLHCEQSGTCPYVMQIDHGAEAWLKALNLLTQDGMGNDIELPENVRLYYMSGTPHSSGPNAPEGAGRGYRCQQPSNPAYSGAIERSLVIAMRDWIVDRILPPPSEYARLSNGTLAPPLPQSAMGFPEIPGVNYTGWHIPLALRDKSTLPWQWIPGTEYVVMVPKTDADGNDLAGIKPVEVAVPLATYTGWDLRSKPWAENEDCEGGGQFIPFPSTRAERERTGDPRLSIEERYRDFADYRNQVHAYVDELIRRRLLLPDDEAALKGRLATQWVRFPVTGSQANR
jgi:hypothetical protein